MNFMPNIEMPIRPREVVCFKPIAFNTLKEGQVYIFFAFDVYTKFMMVIDGFVGLGAPEIIEQVQALMKHKDFTKHSAPFTLVMDIGQELAEELNLIVERHSGKVIFSEQFIKQEMMPDLHEILENLHNGNLR